MYLTGLLSFKLNWHTADENIYSSSTTFFSISHSSYKASLLLDSSGLISNVDELLIIHLHWIMPRDRLLSNTLFETNDKKTCVYEYNTRFTIYAICRKSFIPQLSVSTLFVVLNFVHVCIAFRSLFFYLQFSHLESWSILFSCLHHFLPTFITSGIHREDIYLRL